jgi:hypothetical protein
MTVSRPPADQQKLIETSVAIFGEPAAKRDAAYMPRELIQVTLPHKNPGNLPVWERTNGSLTVVIQPAWNSSKRQSYGYPYGTIPRLLLFWVTTQAIRTKSRRIELGRSLSGFMTALGLNSSNGGLGAKRSDARRLREQMERLFRAKISFDGHGENRQPWLDMQVADKGEYWWNPRTPDQGVLWGSWIELGERFYEAITAFPVPADMRALQALKRSPLALDLYAWLTYEAFRAHRNGKARFETWSQLHAHLGAEYTHLNNFRASAKGALSKIRTVYPGLKLGKRLGGVEVLPQSWPAIRSPDLMIERSG